MLAAAGEAQHFQGQNRKNAGHQVEDGAPGEGQQQHVGECRHPGFRVAGCRPARRRAARSGTGADAARGEIHRKVLGLGRVAQAGIGAALGADLQGGPFRDALRREQNIRLLVVDLHQAEVLVLPLQCRRVVDGQWNGLAPGLQGEVETVLVEIVVVRYLPVGAQAAVVTQLDFQLVGFLHRQELRLLRSCPERIGAGGWGELGAGRAGYYQQ